jgi:hypothetical protein
LMLGTSGSSDAGELMVKHPFRRLGAGGIGGRARKFSESGWRIRGPVP